EACAWSWKRQDSTRKRLPIYWSVMAMCARPSRITNLHQNLKKIPMSPITLLTFLFVYFGILLGVSYFTSRKTADNATFFVANKSSKWYMVAFGMIGVALSGVTFISVPGAVGVSNFSYFQFVLGNALGFLVIAYVLLPLYYRMNLTSIYTYLEDRL